MCKNGIIKFAAVFVVVGGYLISLGSVYGQNAPNPKGRQGGATPPTSSTAPPKKNDTFTVIQIGGDISVVPTSSISDKNKSLKTAYDQALKQYNDAKKKDKDTDVPKPDKVKDYTLKILKKGFKTQDEAEEYRKQEQEKQKNGDNSW